MPYGVVAAMAGFPGRARLVGHVLRTTAEDVPWYRVVNASWRISFPEGSDAFQRQYQRLQEEGVTFLGQTIAQPHRLHIDLRDAAIWG